MFTGVLHKLTVVSALAGILLISLQGAVRTVGGALALPHEPTDPPSAPFAPPEGPSIPEEPVDPDAPVEGADGPSPLAFGDGVPSAMLDRVRSSSPAQADRLLSASRAAAVACGDPNPAKRSGQSLSATVEVAAWRMLDLRRARWAVAIGRPAFDQAPRDPSIATTISIHGPPNA
jgi:hypothetical protein